MLHLTYHLRDLQYIYSYLWSLRHTSVIEVQSKKYTKIRQHEASMSQTNIYKNPVSNPYDIKENNTNGIEETGSLQNACSVLLIAHCGFVNLKTTLRHSFCALPSQASNF